MQVVAPLVPVNQIEVESINREPEIEDTLGETGEAGSDERGLHELEKPRDAGCFVAVLRPLPGPPEQIAKAFDELFADKIATTKIACMKARQALGWPARA